MTAGTHDFNEQMRSHAPMVFAFVLALCFLLLLVTFRSLVIAIKAVLLNLLSVGAAYGLLVLVFQHRWAEGLLGFHSNGAITSWLPLFMFVILFGLSMDYHVFILSRIKELRDGGMSTEDAIANGIKRTAATVTSAAIVMVAVFAIFVSLRTLDIKQMGFGLAAAILIDATIVRGVLLPAVMKLLGEWNWYLPRWLEWLPRLEAETERRRGAQASRRAHRGGRSGIRGRVTTLGQGGSMKAMKQSTASLLEELRGRHGGCWWSTTTRASAAAPGRSSPPRASTSSARPRTGPRRSRLAAELEPDLVVLDVQLPDLDGFEVAARLLARRSRARDRARLEPRAAGVRAADRAERRARLRRQGRALGGGAREAAGVSSRPAFPPAAAPERARDGPRGRARGGLPPLALALTALAATGAAVYTTATSRHAPNPAGHAALMVVVCLTFVGAGVVALRRPPYARFGLLLAAVGLSALLGGLHDANAALPYTVGVLSANLVFALLVHALLAFPKGRLFSRADRAIVVAAYANVLALQALAVLVRPADALGQRPPAQPRPRRLARVARDGARGDRGGGRRRDRARRRGAALAACARGDAGGAPAARAGALRRQGQPADLRRRPRAGAALVGRRRGRHRARPARLGRAPGRLPRRDPARAPRACGRGRAARRAARGRRAPDLQDALRRALGDPSLELARRDEDGRFVDGGGRPLALPAGRGRACRHADPPPARGGRRPRPRPLAAPAAGAARRGRRRRRLRARERARARDGAARRRRAAAAGRRAGGAAAGRDARRRRRSAGRRLPGRDGGGLACCSGSRRAR